MAQRTQKIKRVLIAGASGNLGRELSAQLVDAGYEVRALIHKTPLQIKGVECVRGNVSDLPAVRKAMKGMDAVCQLATTKEDPESFIDVSIRGTWNLLEAARESGKIQRWILAGGDAAMGIYYYPQPGPINEGMPHRAYPGVYALSKVMEEVLGRQYHIQYGLPYTCLRCSWIMHDQMILRTLLARNWPHHLTAAQKQKLKNGTEYAALATHPSGRPLLRHVVGIHDVTAAFLLALDNPRAVRETFNIAAPRPFGYDEAAAYLAGKTGWPTMKIKVPEAHDFEIDIRKARKVLGYRPAWSIGRIIDEALHARGNM